MKLTVSAFDFNFERRTRLARSLGGGTYGSLLSSLIVNLGDGGSGFFG
jgi:hypothetical protein